MPAPRRPDLVLGWREWLRLPDLLGPRPIHVKIDTGAKTSALHAWNIERFERHGRTWARFALHPLQRNDELVVPAEAPVVDIRDIRSSNGSVQSRIVIATTLAVGEAAFPIELTLTRRDRMGFRMLLGRTAMAGRLVVDPAASHLLGVPPRSQRSR